MPDQPHPLAVKAVDEICCDGPIEIHGDAWVEVDWTGMKYIITRVCRLREAEKVVELAKSYLSLYSTQREEALHKAIAEYEGGGK